MKRRILIVIMLSIAFVCNAQTKLSLEESRKMALEHNQSIKIAETELESSEIDCRLSNRSILPQFDLSSSFTHLNDPMEMNIPSFELPTTKFTPSGVLYPGGKTPLAYSNSYGATMEVGLPLYMGGKLREVKRISSLGRNMAKESLAIQKADVLYSTDQQYWSLVALKERKSLAEKSIAFLSDIVKDTKNRYESEIVTKNEVLKTKVELNDAKLSLIELSDGIQLAKMALNKVIGNNILTDIELVDSIVNIPNSLQVFESIDKSLENSHEINIMKTQVKMSESELKMLKSEFKPQLVSFANYLYQSSNHLGQNEGEFTWNAGLSLSIPVFHWGERSLKVRQQKLKNRATKLNYESTREYIMLDIQQTIFKVQESLMKIKITKESLAQAEENLMLEKNRLNEGLITTTDILNAQLQWQVSYANYIDAKANFKISMAAYEKTIGKLE